MFRGDYHDRWQGEFQPLLRQVPNEHGEVEAGCKPMFSTALPYLEKALDVDPEDRETLRSLRDIYARIGMDEKMLEVSAKLKSME